MDQSRILVDVALKAWSQQISRAEKFFDAQTDDGLLKEVAPGRNRLIYLLGHLTSSNETMMTLFGLGPKLYPGYEETFSRKPDKSGLPFPAVDELRKAFRETNKNLTEHFAKMSVNDWLSKHTAMTDEDLAKEPTRNRLSVMMSRTSHVAYHMGQAVLVK